MSTFTLTHSDLVSLLRDYPDTDDNTLAERYGIPSWTVHRIGLENRLRKDPDAVRRRQSQAAVTAAIMSLPAPPRPEFPRYPGPDYCATCGLTNTCAPSCPGGHRATSPNWRP